MTKALRFLAVAACLAFLDGCGGFHFVMPDQYKGQKLKEDPPLLAPEAVHDTHS